MCLVVSVDQRREIHRFCRQGAGSAKWSGGGLREGEGGEGNKGPEARAEGMEGGKVGGKGDCLEVEGVFGVYLICLSRVTCQRERTESGGERASAQGREIRMRATRFAVKLIAVPAFVCACVRAWDGAKNGGWIPRSKARKLPCKSTLAEI